MARRFKKRGIPGKSAARKGSCLLNSILAILAILAFMAILAIPKPLLTKQL
jgi:hypothetical protein